MYSDGYRFLVGHVIILAKSCDLIELLQASEALCMVRYMIVFPLSPVLLYSCVPYQNTFFQSLVSSAFPWPLSILMLYNNLYTPQNTATHFFVTFRCTTATFHYYLKLTSPPLSLSLSLFSQFHEILCAYYCGIPALYVFSCFFSLHAH